jgi:2-dehydro-3-deoxygalactonokinase
MCGLFGRLGEKDVTGLASNPPFCAAADWGTSNLRLWLLAADGSPLRELRSEEGLTKVADRNFAGVLDGLLSELGAAPDLPVIICGMAGSRQGWVEAPYVETPASLDDVLLHAVRAPHPSRGVRILPGIAQKDSGQPDVMRGEETQLLGLAQVSGERTVCMPGTHCKWVSLDGRGVTGFTTFLTGELFNLFSSASLLRHSVDPTARIMPDDADFLQACRELTAEPDQLPARLFSIRAASLLSGLTPPRASAVLSGMLIGAEIGAARKSFPDGKLVLVGSGRLGQLYEAALVMAGYTVEIAEAEGLVRSGLHAAASAFWPAVLRNLA